MTNQTETQNEQIKAIATGLGFPTLETRSSDALDFREVAVWTVRDALNQAYEAGQRQAAAEADDDLSVAFEDDGCVFKAMQAQMSPEAVATIADAISACHTSDIGVDKELRWLVGNLIRNLGGFDAQAGMSRVRNFS